MKLILLADAILIDAESVQDEAYLDHIGGKDWDNVICTRVHTLPGLLVRSWRSLVISHAEKGGKNNV